MGAVARELCPRPIRLDQLRRDTSLPELVHRHESCLHNLRPKYFRSAPRSMLPPVYRPIPSPAATNLSSLIGTQIGAGWTIRSPLHCGERLNFWTCEHIDSAAPAIAVVSRQQGSGDSNLGASYSSSTNSADPLARLAYLTSTLPGRFAERCIDTSLDASTPYVLFPVRTSPESDEWFRNLPQPASLNTLISMSQHLLEGLSQLHQLGFAHTRLETQNILIGSNGLPILAGLANSLPIATYCSRATHLPRMVGRAAIIHDCHRVSPDCGSPEWVPPECRASEFEVSSAQDIYQLAYVFADWFGPSILHSPFGKAMTSVAPTDRPTASELLYLLQDLASEEGLDNGYRRRSSSAGPPAQAA